MTHKGIIWTIMETQNLNVPALVRRMHKVLKSKQVFEVKADRTTVYRIVTGETKKPHPVLRNALLEALHVEGADAERVWWELGGSGPPPPVATPKKIYPIKKN